jgi:hypothetical protein
MSRTAIVLHPTLTEPAAYRHFRATQTIIRRCGYTQTAARATWNYLKLDTNA